MSNSKPLPGFRLEHFEVLNWGTFDRYIWSLDVHGSNSLLTGDIGSGKSTLIDAMTTLLVPAGKITYNKAAGAEGKERSLANYVLGHYKKEKNIDDDREKEVSLRERSKAFSVLLGTFRDRHFNETVTLVQVMWFKENKNQPERFFVVSSLPMTIEEDIYLPDSDLASLKKKLKADPENEVYDTYSKYSTEFRRRMAIQSQQAIELLYQTVSMKSIGNLTDFVRIHMLEETQVKEDLEKLCNNFTNLNQAHEAVIKARHQIEELTPMVKECDIYDDTEGEAGRFLTARESIYSYIAGIETDLLQAKIEKLKNEKNRTEKSLQKYSGEIDRLEKEREKIRKSIDENGGRRLNELEQEIEELKGEEARRKIKNSDYAAKAESIGISLPADEEGFYNNIPEITSRISQYEKHQHEKREQERDIRFEIKRLDELYTEIEKELNSLRKRPTNIPSVNLAMRKKMCEALDIPEDQLPFAGELISIKTEEKPWEGAIERLLRNFGLSILVADQYYEEVSDFVDQTNLRGRLVYFRIKETGETYTAEKESGTVISKLTIKPGSSFYSWLEREIANRFDYICCETIDEFRHQPRALTLAGQVKTGAVRHEKDDRYNINDKSRYILGWNNAEKIKIFEEQLDETRKKGERHLENARKFSREIEALTVKRDEARDLQYIEDYREIDWKSIVKSIGRCTEEVRILRESADILNTLQEQLSGVERGLKEEREKKEKLLVREGELTAKLKEATELQEKAQELFKTVTQEVLEKTFPLIDSITEETRAGKKITLENIGSIQKKIRESVQGTIDALVQQNRRRQGRITVMMQEYKTKYPVETSEFDAAIEAADEYRAVLEDLTTQDLPRHEARFKSLLREGTIQDIALFRSNLERLRSEITEKIESINESLCEIEYNRGSYIKLIPGKTNDKEIWQFMEDLKLSMSDTLNDDGDVYTESKFIQVKNLVDRFEGRPGLLDADKKWTEKVTDVRNWFIFSASERWFEDDREKEFYSDSSGKSGGQKEKLAYTILAAALAYQFSLVNEGMFKRSFRFVMIDEAFGRGSDESARYGLQLFQKLNLQLLIATPLQKIHVIEDFVSSVHFVYQEDDRSRVGNMTIEEYKENKEMHHQTI